MIKASNSGGEHQHSTEQTTSNGRVKNEHRRLSLSTVVDQQDDVAGAGLTGGSAALHHGLPVVHMLLILRARLWREVRWPCLAHDLVQHARASGPRGLVLEE